MDGFKEVKAMVYSTNSCETVEIISYKDNNHVVARYQGKRCTAVFNIFRGLYYVDDVYGVLPDDYTPYGY